MIRYKNFSPTGDLLTALPGIRHLYRKRGLQAHIMQRLNVPVHFYKDAVHAIVDDKGMPVGMNKKQWEMLIPLLKYQEYIGDCSVWQGELFDFDLDAIRSLITTMPYGPIQHWQWFAYPQMACDLSEAWIRVPAPQEAGFAFAEIVLPDHILVNFTERYRNPLCTYFFLKKWEDRIIFAGTEREHQQFCEQNNLSIRLLKIDNFLQLAIAISRCKFFMGNQSMCWHIADGLKHPRLLEVCTAVPNSFPTGKNGYSYIFQTGLEHYVNKMIKE